MLGQEKREWRFETYEEIQEALKNMMAAVKPYYQGRKGRLKLGNSGAVYNEGISQIEAFLRMLWGLGPLLVQEDTAFQAIYLAGITSGTDPKSVDYWGEVADYDQRLVEMAALAVTLIIAKARTWDCLSKKSQNNLVQWLDQINDKAMPTNNWYFFRILVNTCFIKLGLPHNQEKMDEAFALLDSHYVGKGWYYDGKAHKYDYYIAWAYHFYGLIYAAVMTEKDPERSQLFKARATEFAQSYAHLFDSEGAAVPFGRSMIYRFAQSAFWAAMVYADVEALPWGVIKGLYARNMSNWFNHNDIFSTEGRLTLGYSYENAIFTEGYNAPGSPYWAFKSFLILAVPKNHPYWQTEAKSYPQIKKRYLNTAAQAFYEHVSDNQHTLMYPYGQYIHNQTHSEAKYSKFVYSSKFGFSVQKSAYCYYEAALDNVLAISEDGHYFRPKHHDLRTEACSNFITYDWEPLPEVKIQSTIVPCGSYHVRIHEINTGREIQVREGGFSVGIDDDAQERTSNCFASYISSFGKSEILGVQGFESAEVVQLEPNTNLLFQRTCLPTLSAKLCPGQYALISIVGGIYGESKEKIPQVRVIGTKVKIEAHTEITIQLKEEISDKN